MGWIILFLLLVHHEDKTPPPDGFILFLFVVLMMGLLAWATGRYGSNEYGTWKQPREFRRHPFRPGDILVWSAAYRDLRKFAGGGYKPDKITVSELFDGMVRFHGNNHWFGLQWFEKETPLDPVERWFRRIVPTRVFVPLL